MNPLTIVQTALALLLILLIVLQNRGAGLGSAWGGGGEFYGTRRGVEKILFRLTIAAAVLFVVLSFASLFV